MAMRGIQELYGVTQLPRLYFSQSSKTCLEEQMISSLTKKKKKKLADSHVKVKMHKIGLNFCKKQEV